MRAPLAHLPYLDALESKQVEGYVVAVCTRTEPSESIAKPRVPRITLAPRAGVVGDVHAGRSRRQVFIATLEDIQAMRDEVGHFEFGVMGENLVLGIPPGRLVPGARLEATSGALLEVTEARKPCVELEEIAPGLLAASLGRSGVFARVVRAGTVGEGDAFRLTA